MGTARTKAGIPLEKAARDTHIRVQRLREIEADDFSGFAHPTYARLFLLDYAEYLGIPQDEIRPLLPDRAGSAAGGFQYIEALSSELPAMQSSPRRRRLRILSFIVSAVVLVVLIAAGLLIYFWAIKIERVARSKPLGEQAVPAAAAMPESPSEPVSESAGMDSPAGTEDSSTLIDEQLPSEVSPSPAPTTP